jgi:D-beta-D-heptose 7-phosphate kinase/D-beta-D-heptose 1-phosphate adenosyltransferase
MDAAAESGALVVVDPKRRDLGAYRGASFITPNRKELSEAVGLPCKTDEEAASAAKVAIKQSGAAILLTRSERGMSLYRPNAKPVHLAAEAREVFDVSGAGDTVAALLGLGLAAKLPPEEAMRAANAAAGIVVGKLGTATCSPAELLRALTSKDGRPDPHAGLPDVEGAVALAEAVRVREQWAGAGLSVGFANGCFDLLHPGHVRLLRRAAAECDRLIVAINSDASVRNLKGPTRPVQNEAARAQVLASIKGVDLVIVFEEPTPLEVVQALQPDMIVKGADYTEDEVVGGDVVKARGGRVLLVDLAEGHSTTSILARAGDLS